MTCFDLPEDAKYYLLLQRTEYQSGFLKKVFRNINYGGLNLRGVYDRYLLPYFDRNTTDELSEKYYSDLEQEFDQMKPYLPDAPRNALDIGCGLGGINVFLNEYYGYNVDFYLLDKSDVTEIYYSFEQEAAAYNSLEITRTFLEANGLGKGQLNTVDIDRAEFPTDTEFGLIISLLSWGHHYPLDTYLEAVKESLAYDGRVITDIRKRTDGMELLNEEFEQVTTISDNRKRARVLATSPVFE